MNRYIIATLLVFILSKVQAQSDNFNYHFDLGNKAIEKQDYEKAIKQLSKALKIRESSDVYFNRAAAYFYKGDTCLACADLKSALDLNDREALKLFLNKCTFIESGYAIDSITSTNSNKTTGNPIHAYCQPDSALIRILHIANLGPTYIPYQGSSPFEVYNSVDEMPVFPGGEKALKQYLIDNVIYPARAYENDISGTVQLSCIIDCVGKVSNVKVLRGIGGGCDEEAVRVIRSMPAWKPGRKDMITVNVEVIIEFTYNSKTRRH